MSKIVFIKNANKYVKSIKNNLNIANICKRNTPEIYKGE